jgi:hypothetical protein
MYSKLSLSSDSPIVKKLRESIYDGVIKAQDVHKDSRYKYNKEAMLFLLKTYSGSNVDISKWVDSSFLSNKEFLLEAFQIVRIEYSFQNLPKEMQQDKDILNLLLQTDLRNFPSYDISIRDTEAFARKAVKTRLTNLEYVSDRLKNDKKFLLSVLIAYRKNPDPLFDFYGYLPETLKNDDDFILNAVAQNEKILSLVKTTIRKDKAKMKQILALNGLALKYASKDIQKDKELVSIAVSQNYQSFEFASSILKSDRNFVNELEQINPDILDLADPIFTDEKLRQEENIFFENQPDSTEEVILIKWGVTTLRFQSKGLLSQVLKFKSALNKAVAKIESSPIPQFKKILDMTIDVITSKDYKKKFGKSPPAKAAAFYTTHYDTIKILLDVQNDPNYIGASIIHELAHRFHYLHIRNGANNKEIIDLFKIATNKRYCQYAKVPQVGDPITDLNINELSKKWTWTNKMASLSDYFLKEKNNWVYLYENSAGDKIEITNSEMPHILKCPSQYGSQDAIEFFAEMMTLITINKVKPSQRMVADKFLEIVLRNIK